MSQFRVKNIDNGIVDDWNFRINDDGAIPGDEIVAADPNELAQAITDTQDLLVHSTVYSPNDLIDSAHGALERIKIIEDTFGSITLQNAYDEGRSITVTPGRNLLFGSQGEIELDSSGNLKFNPVTMKVHNGAGLDMNISYNGISSGTTDLLFSTTLAGKNLTLDSGEDLFLKDRHLLSPVPLSESGVNALATTAQSIVSAINEINGGFTSADFQQIYNQSSPPRVTTTLGNGPVNIVNGSGSPLTPAISLDGGLSTNSFLNTEELNIKDGVTTNLTIDNQGNLISSGAIQSNTKIVSALIENSIGELTFLDSRGSASLTGLGDGSLTTTKQSLFGAINELDTELAIHTNQLASLSSEHDLSTGEHKIITTQSSLGQNSVDRFIFKDDTATPVITMNGEGVISANDFEAGLYAFVSEASANETHRNGDGTDHSAVSTHIGSTSEHGVSGDIVGTIDPQALINKTISSSTIESGTLNGPISGTSIKDEDNLFSNSNIHIATQQSIKAYVDSSVSTLGYFINLNDTPSSFNSGRILFEGATEVEDSSLLFWDDTNKRLGINNGSPQKTLDLDGGINITENISVGGTQVVTSQISSAAAPQSENIFLSSGAGSTQGDFVIIYDQSGNTTGVWLDIDANGTPPAGPLFTATGTKIEVDISSADTDIQAAAKFFTAVDGVIPNISFYNNLDGSISAIQDIPGSTLDIKEYDATEAGTGSMSTAIINYGKAVLERISDPIGSDSDKVAREKINSIISLLETHGLLGA